MRFDHAGIATENFAGTVELFGNMLDADLVHEEEFDGLRVGFLGLGNGYLEVLEPLADDGPISTYLSSHGPGIHHLAFETANATTAVERARDMDIEPIDDEPRAGAWGHQVAFLHPRDTGGVLIEFVER